MKESFFRNRIRKDLAENGFTVGSWLVLGSPMAAELMASVGFSWLCIDLEHSPLGLNELAQMIRATEARGATPIVRVPNDDSTTIGQILDAGALGIVVPHVRTAEQAKGIAQACRYPPRGRRSMGTGRANTFGEDYADWINKELVVFAQIEESEGVKNSFEILSVDGIDIGFIGPKDLAIDMNTSMGSQDHERAILRVLEAGKEAGKYSGIPIRGAEDFETRRKQGFDLFDLSSDFRLLQSKAASEWNKTQL